MPIKPQKSTLIVLSATMFAAMPLLAPLPVQAADDAPTARQAAAKTVTIEAVVIDKGDKDRFRVAADGETFYVLTMGQIDVQKGDHVVLKGSFNDYDYFEPDSVDFVDPDYASGDIDDEPDTPNDRPDDRYNGPDDRNDGPDDRDNDERDNCPDDRNDRPDDRTPRPNRPDFRNQVSFPATITRNLSKYEIEVRGDNGRTYQVELRDTQDAFRVGDLVRVDGYSVGIEVRGARLMARNGGINPNPPVRGRDEEPLQTVDFPARITRLDKAAKEATVRGDNGRVYEIRGEDVREFGVGSHVRVRGVLRAGVVQLDRLDLWRY